MSLIKGEESTNNICHKNEIAYLAAEVAGVPARIMIYTGPNVSLINSTELEKIQKECHRVLPTLPINTLCYSELRDVRINL